MACYRDSFTFYGVNFIMSLAVFVDSVVEETNRAGKLHFYALSRPCGVSIELAPSDRPSVPLYA
jgi:hypothetical protein